MSNMLEQAIMDAETLREAALKNAENILLEKYSSQIKDAVEQLLEGDEQQTLSEQDDMNLDSEAGSLGSIDDQAPLASMESEKACPCPDESEVVEINLDQLEKAVSDAMGAEPSMAMDQPSDDPQEQPEMAGLMEAIAEAGIEIEEEEEETKNLQIDESHIKELVEKLTVDIRPTKSGWAGTPESQFELAEEELLALEQDSKVKEERAAMRKLVDQLSEAKTNLETQLKGKTDYISKLENAVKILKENFDKVNVANARLLYTNKALTSDSLNERQKDKLAEAISKAETVDEAKVIFETLQSTVGSVDKKTQPQSLSEAISKDATSTILMSRPQRETKSENPSLNRWKILAGINNNK
tara:strand:+ start:702 stop:1769 length:1068 start_codon:yes stop_codon:yes gene_type:complete